MRTERQVEEFQVSLRGREAAREGGDPDGDKVRQRVALYEACVPRDFWDATDEQITHNRDAFDRYVVPYCERLREARRHGYGLLLLGPNGAGKTIFSSWILRRVCSSKWGAYYTTAPQLEHNLRRGMQDRTIADRLEGMLDADFLAIDELGKERFRDGDSFARVHLERVLKARFDERLPTILATNAKRDELREALGESVMSIVDGKYQVVQMEPGDFRKSLGSRMRETMGFPGDD